MGKYASSWVPSYYIEDEEWDDLEAPGLLAEIEANGFLSAVGFNREPGGVEAHKTPTEVVCKPRKAVTAPPPKRRRAAPPPPPVLVLVPAPQVDLVEYRTRRLLQEQIDAKRIEQAKAYNKAIEAQREQRRIEDNARQEAIGTHWAIEQLHNISHQINVLLMRGDTYRASLMKQAAQRVLQAYPSLHDLQIAAMRLRITR